MKVLRKIIQINEELCDGCGLCVPACDEGAIQVIDGKARVVAEKYCDGLGACLGECPQGAISIVERVAEDFDPEAVEEYLRSRGSDNPNGGETLACGCPSTQMQTFAAGDKSAATGAGNGTPPVSNLGHWPVQIRLVPPHAPFLQGADLLILADCAAVAYAGLHQQLLKNRVVLMGCPKFDDLPDYEERFVEIFSRNQLKSITVVLMEVPCCSGLPGAVKKALARAGKNPLVNEMVLNLRGEPLD